MLFFILVLRDRCPLRKIFWVWVLVQDLCGDLALFEKMTFEENCMGPFPGVGVWPECGLFALMPLSLSLQHKYTSIAEVQAQMEEEYLRSPLSGVSWGPSSAHRIPAVRSTVWA